MKGIAESDGTVTITFNSQCERLRAPDRILPDGSREAQQWLPCSWCGHVLPRPLTTVAFVCRDCERAEEAG